jgi:hydroxymethylglutaryl-CoA lyase
MRWVECPRDAWQGFAGVIPTEQKVNYLLALLEAGFTHLDLTSFVSARAVPQHADAEAVLAALPPPQGREYLAIVANQRGLERALAAPHLTTIGYPLSLSETFQLRNVQQTLEQGWQQVLQFRQQLPGHLKLVVYLSMAFGNPYGDPHSASQVMVALERLHALGVGEVALADTYGVATAADIDRLLAEVPPLAAPVQLGLHLHSPPEQAMDKARIALDHGIRWLEGALSGQGGCPFAGDIQVGNLPTERIWPLLVAYGLASPLPRLEEVLSQARQLRWQYDP